MTLLQPGHGVTRHVGAALRRVEDPVLLVGGARFLDDLVLPGMLHAGVLRSPVAHGRVRGVDTSGLAVAVELVLGPDVLVGATHPQPVLWVLPGQWQTERALVDGTVRYVGDPVGVVVAADRSAVADALEQLVVEVDELAPLVGIDAALEGATLLYPEHATNVMAAWTTGDDDAHTDAVFAAAEHQLALDLQLGRVAGVPMEPRGIVVDPGPPGPDGRPEKLTIWTSTQAPHAVRDAVAAVCGLAQHRIRVVAPDVGGGFGVKDHIYDDELLVVLAALRLGRPVKWVEGRGESLTTTHQARGERCRVEVAYDGDGTLRGIRVDAVRDCGASFSIFGAGPLFALCGSIAGPYRWAAVQARARAVCTTTCPVHSYRGFGQTQGTFVREVAVDAVAAHLGVDPLELRLRNCITRAEQPWPLRTAPLHYDDGDYPESLRLARELVAAWPPPPEDGRRWGTACALYVQQAGVGPSQGNPHIGLRVGSWESTTLRMERDGSVRALVGTSAHGQGHRTAYAQLLADRLGTSPAMIEVVQSDTDVTPYSAYGTAGSRSIAVGGGSAVLAAERLATRLAAIAADLLEAAPEDVVLGDGVASVRGTPARSLPLSDVAARAWQGWQLPPGAEPGLVEHAVYDPPEFTWSYSTHVCRVAVDAETGQVEVDRYGVVLDCGTIVNPMIVEGQVHGGVAQGLGPVLLEEVVVDEHGQPRTATLFDYLIPTFTTTPAVETRFHTIASPHTPGGMKGMGEGGTTGGFSVVAGTVRAALPEAAARLTTTPYTPERIWAALRPLAD